MLILNLNIMNTACHNEKQQGADKNLLWVSYRLILWSFLALHSVCDHILPQRPLTNHFPVHV